MNELHLRKLYGMLTIQDLGRPGYLMQGLSRGGAMDRLAVLEAAALLCAPRPLAGIEMAGAGGEFEVSAATRIALTGAPMLARLDGAPLQWHASHRIVPGQILSVTGVRAGSYGYLTPAGGMATPDFLDSRSAHLNIGVFEALKVGRFPVFPDPDPMAPSQFLESANRFQGGRLRVIDGPQTDLFDPAVIAAFYDTEFLRSPRGNRHGVRFDAERRFTSDLAAGLASDLIGPGDVQMTGDGVPYVLLAECQTMGGYPRIGSVIPADLAIAAQAPVGAKLSFQRISMAGSDRIYQPEALQLKDMSARCRPIVRDLSRMTNLLSYQLISGATAGHELEE